MTVRIVRLGTPRHPGEGTRIGTVRRPPRGVPKAEFASGDWYDVWFPNLSPSPELVKRALASQADLSAAGEKEWAAFTRGYRAEMARLELDPDPQHVVDGDFFLASGYEAARRLIGLSEPPTAIFAAGDEMAIGALHALADAPPAKLRAPLGRLAPLWPLRSEEHTSELQSPC